LATTVPLQLVEARQQLRCDLEDCEGARCARPPYYGTRRYILRAMRPKLDWLRLIPGRKPRTEDTEGPTVVLVTDDGREVVIQRPGTFGQACRAAGRFDRELSQVGLAEFCLRYGVALPGE
jgi:hypothetical protein